MTLVHAGIANAGQAPAVQSCHDLLLWVIPQLDKLPRVRRFTLGKHIKALCFSVRAELVEARASTGHQPISMFPQRDWLICLWRRAADVFVQDAGYQALIGQAFLGGSPL